VDLDVQANCYKALFETVYKQDFFAGIHFWAWFPTPYVYFPGAPFSQSVVADNTFAVHLKPAQDVIKTYYSQTKG